MKIVIWAAAIMLIAMAKAEAREQPNANRIAARHQPVAVVLDLVNPVGAGRRSIGGGRKAGLDEAAPGRRGRYAQHGPGKVGTDTAGVESPPALGRSPAARQLLAVR